jgi:predicted nucleic acid-binding protein
MVSFDTNVLVYATASLHDPKALRARDLIARAMRAGWTILLLQTLAEFANVATREAGIPIEEIRGRGHRRVAFGELDGRLVVTLRANC